MKTLLRSAARGFLWGILAHYLFTLGISLILRLGYYAPCLVSMGERFGGELNGALVECLCAAILGAGLALLLPIHKRLRAHRLASAPCCCWYWFAPPPRWPFSSRGSTP